jgi:hypothetical protein
MPNELTRRQVMIAAGLGSAGLIVQGASAQPESARPVADEGAGWTHFPNLDPKLIAEIVGKSHRDEKRVRELVDMHPQLVNAAWDWGFGDWETPLGAASHVGRREIAEFLIERGARIDIFAAAMLGYTDVVKAFVTTRPGVQKLLGPHGIPLLAHARAGGDKAKDTYDYLESLGDAGVGLEAKPISEAERKQYTGVYAFGDGAGERFEIKLDARGNLAFSHASGASPMIHSLGNDEFFPSGVHTTRFLFDLAASPVTVKITAGIHTLTAKRI